MVVDPAKPMVLRSAIVSIRYLLLLGLCPMVLGACNLLVDFEDEALEASPAACRDGIDNDFDGAVDCNDADCRCTRCDPPGLPLIEGDGLGAFCEASCECRRLVPSAAAPENLRVCNPNAVAAGQPVGGRCLTVSTLDASGAVATEESSFDIHFVMERAPSGDTRPEIQDQNVAGIARFEGRSFPFSAARWSGSSPPTLTFFGADRTTSLDVLLDFPLATDVDTLFVGDRIDGTTPSDGLRTQLGPFTQGGGIPEGINQLAVIESSTLTISALASGEAPSWVGRFQGRLRSPYAIDRASGGRGECSDSGRLFQPSPQGCFLPVFGRSLFFAFGCVLEADALAQAGRVAYDWRNPFDASDVNQARFNGRCAARRTNDGLEARIATDIITDRVSAVLELKISEGILAPGTNVDLFGNEQVSATAYQISHAGQRLFDLDLSEAVRSETIRSGRLAMEFVNDGVPPRFFGWLVGGF